MENVGNRQLAITLENIAKVAAVIQRNPRKSIRIIVPESRLTPSKLIQNPEEHPTHISVQDPMSSTITVRTVIKKRIREQYSLHN